MKKKYWYIIVPVVLVLVWIITSYNSLVNVDEDAKNKWGKLQSIYQSRLELLPNLVSVLKLSSEYEKTTLEKVTTLRAQAGQLQLDAKPNGEDYQKLENVQGELATNMNRIIAVVEKYPDIKTQRNFLRFQDQIRGIERRIQVARNDLNESVARYNRKVRGFPSNIPAAVFGFKKKTGFRADEGADTAPEVKLQN